MLGILEKRDRAIFLEAMSEALANENFTESMRKNAREQLKTSLSMNGLKEQFREAVLEAIGK